jgi:signal transduction histidine kinase
MSLDQVMLLVVALCAVSTVVVLLPGIHGHAIVPAIDLVIDTIALVACSTLTALAWARYREGQVIAAAYHASAFMALTAAYGVAVAISLQRSQTSSGLVEPEDVQVLVFAVARLAAAILFVIAGGFTSRRTYGWRPHVILVLPTVAVLAAALAGHWLAPPPPQLLIVEISGTSGLPHITAFGASFHVVTALLFFAGAWTSRTLWNTKGAVIDGWIAIGLVFAGFAELQWMLNPSAHPGQVSTGDLLRLACSITLLYGLENAVRHGLSELRAAYIELADYREVEVEHAALEERARLAREIHDGLAQDLWLAKLRAGELARTRGLDPEVDRAVEEVAAAVDIAISDARQAVAALRSSEHADSGFCNLLRRAVDDYGDRYGLRVEFAFDGDHTAHIAPRTQAEILRIAQEAMANVARHADATIVGVRLSIVDGRITLRIVDNGRGFDATLQHGDRFGLVTMRERAAIIGGRLRVASRAGAGTRIVLTAPFKRPAAGIPGDPR